MPIRRATGGGQRVGVVVREPCKSSREQDKRIDADQEALRLLHSIGLHGF